jgi:hypothetical protein
MLPLGAERWLGRQRHLRQIESLTIADSSVRGHLTKQRWFGSAPFSVGRAIFLRGDRRLRWSWDFARGCESKMAEPLTFTPVGHRR